MSDLSRRTFLKALGGAGAATLASAPLFRALADGPRGTSDEFFVLLHAGGGWDVTLGLDPRNERRGLVEPASTDNTDTSVIRRWVNTPLDADTNTFTLVRPTGSNLTFGPSIGNLADLYSRLCVVNGVAMNTVSHADGTFFSSTGRHLSGGRAVASSVDTMLANEFGRTQLLPNVSVNYPSAFVESTLDRRVIPLRVGSIGTIQRSLGRSSSYESASDRDRVTVLLTEEAHDLAAVSEDPTAWETMGLQYDALRRMLGPALQPVFNSTTLQSMYPTLDYRGRFHGGNAVNLAFALEAMKRNVVRCVSVAFGSFDTHNTNYRQHAQVQQELFDLVAAFVTQLDALPHPTLTGERLADHTHILVTSDFCRTPQINLSGGRDHYPNNSSLIISPRFRGNFVYGSTDVDQVLPAVAGTFGDGMRAVSPPDVLATFLSAVGADPRRYLRDGEVVREMLRS